MLSQVLTYIATLFRAMCLVAFYAFLQVGEITFTPTSASNPPLQLQQLTKLLDSGGRLSVFNVTLYKYKHCYNSSQFFTVIQRQADPCPVQALQDYLDIRGVLFLSSTSYTA